MYHAESKTNSEDNHKGAAVLKLHFDDVNKLSGNYFTDRNSSGRYEFVRK